MCPLPLQFQLRADPSPQSPRREMVPSCLPGSLLTLLLLQLPQLDAAPFEVTGAPEPVLALVGDDAELPCGLWANASAEHVELRWFRGTPSPAVLALRDGRELQDEQLPQYRGRVTLVKDSVTSGRAAVRIRGVRAEDDGSYRCYVRDGTGSAEAVARLSVAALGSDPHISMEVQEGRAVQLECTSVGWYPEPQVQWRTSKGETFLSTTESRSRDEEGLFTVVASLILRDAFLENVSCAIQNALLGKEKEVEVSIPALFLPRLTPWLVVVAIILLVLGLLTIGSIVFIWKLYKRRSRERRSKFSSKEKLLEELKWKKDTIHAVDVTLDPDTAHPHLRLYGNSRSVQLEDAHQKLPDTSERFDTWPCVLGREAFTSGQHYWEVEVGDRTDWAIGVCREDVRRKGFGPLTPENGFWAVELYGSGYWALTPLRTPIPLTGPLSRVGVFLDYETGKISFYSMTDGVHIYTFTSTSFLGPLRPFFCLWSCGKKPLTICSIAGSDEVTVIADVQALSTDTLWSRTGEELCPLENRNNPV
ncbi:butyrophilin subfamily 1 member A1 [Ctenodactylus gundi]